MNDKFRSRSDVSMRLSGCYVLYDGQAYHVEEAVTSHSIGLEGKGEVALNDPLLDLTTPQGGLVTIKVNGVKFLAYVELSPKRQVKMSFHPRRLSVKVLKFRMSPEFDYKDILQQLMNPKKVTTTTCVKGLSNGISYGRALSPSFGITISREYSEILLVHRDYVVGYVKGGTAYLFRADSYLHETLSLVFKDIQYSGG
jgi:hypothetical protein